MSFKLLNIFAAILLLIACGKKPELTELKIMTENGPVTYQVETALTRPEMARGLMDRKSLRADSGMIFNINGEEKIAMYMKDTYIPLDMIFVNKAGEITYIKENAEPLSTTLIHPEVNEPVYFVIEVNGGDVKKNNIKVGDKIEHKLLHPETETVADNK